MRARFLVLVSLLSLSSSAQPPMDGCPTGSMPSGTAAPSGPVDGGYQPIIMTPGNDSGGNTDPMLMPTGSEPPLPAPGTTTVEWFVGNNPNLSSAIGKDPTLANTINQLTPSEAVQLGNLLTTYQQGMGTYIQNNPRAVDGYVNGGAMNAWETLSGNSNMERGCANMSAAAERTLVNQINANGSEWTLHHYQYEPGTFHQFVAPFVAVGGGAVGGSVYGGIPGTIVGGVGGAAGWLLSGGTEHNMSVLVNTRDPNLRIVLDPHGSQSAGPESIHGSDHYGGSNIGPTIKP